MSIYEYDEELHFRTLREKKAMQKVLQKDMSEVLHKLYLEVKTA